MFDNVEAGELSHPLQSDSCLSLCPSMDLLSFQLNDEVIWIYRRGNEKVWDIEPNIEQELETDDNNTNSKKIETLVWKPDGKSFAVVSNDGSLGLFDTMDGTLIRSIQLNLDISCVKWFERNKQFTQKSDKFGILDDISISTSLPTLTTTSSSSIDRNNNVTNKTDNTEIDSILDFIIAGSNTGALSCVFSGIFIVENLTLSDVFQNSQILDIVSNSSLSNHYIILKTIDSNEISLLKLDSEFITKDREFTKILVICSKLLNLIDHIKSSINQINNHYKPYFDYTIRIIELLRGEIKEEEEGTENGNDENNGNNKESNNTDPIYDLYDLLLTGSLSNATKKWLTDYLSDRGVKRWTKLGRTYFDNARSSIYNDLITSLHHLIVYLTDLKGLSQWNSTDTSLYLLDIEECIKISQNYLKYSYKFMMELNDNQRHFEQTLLWLSSILSELTTDEKLNVNFKTNDITKYLMFVSSQINAVDNASKENDPKIFVHDSSKVNSFTKVLNNVLMILFGKIKNDIKSKFKLDTHTLLGFHDNIDKMGIELFDCQDKGYVYFLSTTSEIQINEFNLSDLKITSHILKRNDNKTNQLLDLRLLPEDQMLALFNDSVILYTISKNNLNADYNANVEWEYFIKEELNGDNTEFQAAAFTVNSERRLFCVLDKTRKKYIWVNY